MEISVLDLIGTATESAVKPYRQAPGNFHAAVSAAFHYAKKSGKNMLIIPGNSYMQKVFHIAEEGKSISKYTPPNAEFIGARVMPDGKAFRILFKK